MSDDHEDPADTVRRAHRPLWVGFGYLTALGLVAFWPTTISEPFSRLLGRLDDQHPGSVAQLEFLGNIVLFIPAGLLLALFLGRGRRWLAVVAAVATSVTIEFAQGILLPARFASLSDIIANSTGALVGVLLATAGSGLAPRARQRPAR